MAMKGRPSAYFLIGVTTADWDFMSNDLSIAALRIAWAWDQHWILLFGDSEFGAVIGIPTQVFLMEYE